MNQFALYLLFLAVGLSSCTTMPKPEQVAAPAPKPKESIRKDYLKPRDTRRVRTGEFVKTYHLGRSVRGRAGSTMHEAHRVYRLEKPSRWNLMRDQPPLASTGPVNKVVDSAFKPAPRSKAIQAELNHQRAMTAQLETAHVDLVGAVQEARAQLARSTESAQQMKPIQEENRRLRAEIEKLKGAQSHSIQLPEPPFQVPGEALKQWGDKLESEEK